MKLRTTTPASTSFRNRLGVFLAVLLLAFSVPIQFFNQPVAANNIEERVRLLEEDISRYQQQATDLSQQADSLQREISRLNSQKATIQAQLDISQANYELLLEEIQLTEAQIRENRDALGGVLADLYIDDSISPIEMLASSKNIGDFINKQELRNVTKDSLTEKISEIKRLKDALETKKDLLKKNLADQTIQRDSLVAKEAEQQKLLADTRGDEAAYRELTTKTQEEIAQLWRENTAAINAALRGNAGTAVAGDPNKGGYPSNLANSNYYSPIVDPWGMYSRQCVSYTAWKVYQKNGYMPYWGGFGDAKQWPDNARKSGITVSSVPRVGSVGVIMAGQYGHTVWVESVNANGTVNISQYNYFNAGGPGWGNYSEMYNVSPSAYDYYIYF